MARALGGSDRDDRTGIVRRLDDLGRVVIPSEIRKRLDLSEREPVEISVAGDTVVLAKPRTSCVFCGGSADLREHRGRPVCGRCVAELASGD